MLLVGEKLLLIAIAEIAEVMRKATTEEGKKMPKQMDEEETHS